ncbi:MAG: HD domain-containing protein [Chloroflexi bacterium]|nr:HD domain-containing protein [Chloroflexota bacterium]
MGKISFEKEIPPLVKELINDLLNKGHEVYLVGGAVRDILLGRPVPDWDISGDDNFSSDAIAFWKSKDFPCFMLEDRRNFARLLSDEGWYIDAQPMEGTLSEDMARRDFSINAIAWSPVTGELTDLYGGMNDIEKKLIRAFNPENLKIDPLRLLRAIRLESRLGFDIEDETLNLIIQYAPLLYRAAPERIRDELFKILDRSGSAEIFKRADELKLLGELFPEIINGKGVTQNEFHLYDVFNHSMAAVGELEKIFNNNISDFFPRLNEPSNFLSEEIVPGRKRASLLKLAALLHDVGKPGTRELKDDRVTFYGHQTAGSEIVREIAVRLMLSKKEENYIALLVEHHMRPILLSGLADVTSRARYRLFRDTGEYFPDLMLLTMADMAAGCGPASSDEMQARHKDFCIRLLNEYDRKSSEVKPPRYMDGVGVMELLDMPPGPEVGKILEDLAEASAIGIVKNREEAEKYITDRYMKTD